MFDDAGSILFFDFWLIILKFKINLTKIYHLVTELVFSKKSFV